MSAYTASCLNSPPSGGSGGSINGGIGITATNPPIGSAGAATSSTSSTKTTTSTTKASVATVQSTAGAMARQERRGVGLGGGALVGGVFGVVVMGAM
jgi:hypothetical protein